MIGTYGLPTILETLSVLVASDGIDPAKAPENTAAGQLAWAWQQYIRRRESAIPPVEADHGRLPVYIDDTVQGQALLDAFYRGCLLDNVDYELPRYAPEEDDRLAASSELISRALDGIAADRPEVRTLFGVLLPIVLVAPSHYLAGGTGSSVPGVLWASIKPTWTEIDVREFLLHELVHTTLYMEEYRHGFYRDIRLLPEDENLAPSAIRQDRRTLDKVLHSIVVATEILLARRRDGADTELLTKIHPDSETLRAGALTSLTAVRNQNLEKLLLPRPIEILEKCGAVLQESPLRT